MIVLTVFSLSRESFLRWLWVYSAHLWTLIWSVLGSWEILPLEQRSKYGWIGYKWMNCVDSGSVLLWSGSYLAKPAQKLQRQVLSFGSAVLCRESLRRRQMPQHSRLKRHHWSRSPASQQSTCFPPLLHPFSIFWTRRSWRTASSAFATPWWTRIFSRTAVYRISSSSNHFIFVFWPLRSPSRSTRAFWATFCSLSNPFSRAIPSISYFPRDRLIFQGMPLMKIAGECIKRMDASVTASIEERLEESLNYPTKSILETLGNIIAENDLYASYLLQNGYLAFLSRVYFDKNNGDFLLRLEVIFNWMNLSGGTCSQALYDTGILETLVGNVQALNPQSSSIEFEAARRSMVVICNFICECDDATRLYLLSCNVRGLLEQYLNLVQGRWQDEDHDFIVDMLRRMSE